MNEEKNPFRKMQAGELGLPEQNKPDLDDEPIKPVIKKKPGRPKTKKPVGEPKETRQAVGETAVKKRTPVYKSNLQQTPTRKGFYRRWVNDEGDNLQIYSEAGYTRVLNTDGKPRTRRAKPGIKAYLLEIDEQLHEQDQQEKYIEWNQNAQERLKPREGKGYYQPKTKHQYR